MGLAGLDFPKFQKLFGTENVDGLSEIKPKMLVERSPSPNPLPRGEGFHAPCAWKKYAAGWDAHSNTYHGGQVMSLPVVGSFGTSFRYVGTKSAMLVGGLPLSNS